MVLRITNTTMVLLEQRLFFMGSMCVTSTGKICFPSLFDLMETNAAVTPTVHFPTCVVRFGAEWGGWRPWCPHCWKIRTLRRDLSFISPRNILLFLHLVPQVWLISHHPLVCLNFILRQFPQCVCAFDSFSLASGVDGWLSLGPDLFCVSNSPHLYITQQSNTGVSVPLMSQVAVSIALACVS